MKIKPGKYQHYKGNIFQVIGTALHSETLEELVVYRSQDSLWVRPKKMFLEKIRVNGELLPRFKLIKKNIPLKQKS